MLKAANYVPPVIVGEINQLLSTLRMNSGPLFCYLQGCSSHFCCKIAITRVTVLPFLSKVRFSESSLPLDMALVNSEQIYIYYLCSFYSFHFQLSFSRFFCIVKWSYSLSRTKLGNVWQLGSAEL